MKQVSSDDWAIALCCEFLLLWTRGLPLAKLLAIVPDQEASHICVVNPANLDERYSGPDFAPALWAAIDAVEKAQPETIHA
jgi:hypothetical protein